MKETKEITNDMLSEAKEDLLKAYSASTCHPSYVGKWSPIMPYVGQCAVTSLYLHEKFGYDICDVMVGRSRHFYNMSKEGNIVDFTAEQFNCKINYQTGRIRKPKDIMKSVKNRYEILKHNMQNL